MQQSWHLSKNVTLSTLVGIFVLIAGQIYQYGALHQRIDNLEKQIIELKSGKDDKVDKDVVEQMFITRDVQIIELKENIKENQRILREILTKLPK